MAEKYTRHRIDQEAEVRLATGIIVSDTVCRRLIPILNPDLLKVPYIRMLAQWVINYYKMYEKPPNHHIRDIFEREKRRLDLADAGLMEEFLSKLSDDYVDQMGFNPDYIIDRSLEYLEERGLETLAEGIEENVKGGRLDRARRMVTEYKKVAQGTSRWINIFDITEVGPLLHQAQDDYLFEYPGALGKLVGPFNRGNFCAILAPIKRGKTWMLMETAMVSLMNGFRTAMVSLEMKDRRMAERFYKRIVSAGSDGGELLYPVFDCWNNQTGVCDKVDRSCHNVKLIEEEGDELPDFEKAPKDYKPCDWCRKNDPDSYDQTVWYVQLKRPPFQLELVRKKVRAFGEAWGKNFRLMCYPRFSAGIEDVEGDLDMLEFTEGFIPDVIIIDYIDILKRGEGEFRHVLDELWMSHARMASQRNCLVMTATQSTRKSWEANQVRVGDTSENYRNPAHVDLMLALNQTDEQKRIGAMGVSVVAAREMDFNPRNQVILLQKLGVGQPFLDSEWARGGF